MSRDNVVEPRFPSPRPPIHQGINLNHPLVLEHNQVYMSQLHSVSPLNTLDNALITLNPYGFAPLSAYIGVWVTSPSTITITVGDPSGPAPLISTEFQPVPGVNLIPISGFVPQATNTVTLSTASSVEYRYSVETAPLPPSDSETVVSGFPLLEVTQPAGDLGKLADGLYFACHVNRYNFAFDHTGTVRWFVTRDIPSINLVRLSNGHFLSADQNHDDFKNMYEFDILGRVHAFYVLDNQAHHSILELSDGNIILTSEYTDGREGEAQRTNEDGVSIIDRATGLEIAYYDMIHIMDTSRPPRPSTGSTQIYDWLHLNQTYLDETHNLIISSARHQSAVYGIDATTSAVVFILANHEGWSPQFRDYLLTPVDESGNPLYDLTDPEQIERANHEFWTWGQHCVEEICSSDPNVLEFIIFDNGNYRSRVDEHSFLPPDNYSRIVRFKVNLADMTVYKVYEYGSSLGSDAYSSYVGAQEILPNDNIVIHFGGSIRDINGRALSVEPGYSDLADPLEADEVAAILIMQEIDPAANDVLFEVQFSSGTYKSEQNFGPGYRYDMAGFRIYKMPLYQ